MIYGILCGMAVFIAARLIMFLKNKNSAKSIDDVDALLIRLLNQ